LRNSLAAIDGVTVHDKGAIKGGIVSFGIAKLPARQAQEELLRRHINVSTTSVYSARIDMERRGLDETVRASVHYFNTEDEIAEFASAISNLVSAVA
jgi:selenocysteine lyase/cysteine desulfurase